MRKYVKNPQTDALGVNYYLHLNTWNALSKIKTLETQSQRISNETKQKVIENKI